MIRNLKLVPVIAVILVFSACSMRPERAISLQELKRTKGAAYYIIEDDPEGVLKVLNEKGEVVVKAGYFDDPVYLQIFSTSEGLVIRHYEKDEYTGYEE